MGKQRLEEDRFPTLNSLPSLETGLFTAWKGVGSYQASAILVSSSLNSTRVAGTRVAILSVFK